MAITVSCRRRHSRVPRPRDVDAWVDFRYPDAGGHPCRMLLRDLSQAGLSFELSETLPGLEVGDILRGFRVRIDRRQIRGEFLLMHVTPEFVPGAICGGLFYPASEKDLLEFRGALQDLEAFG